MKKIKKLAKKIINHKYFKYLLPVFIFVLIFSAITPITGDDWGNWIVGSGGVSHSIKYAYNMYFWWEGRFISRILLNVFTYNKWLWNILNAIQISGIIYLAYKMINPKNKVMFLLPIIFLLLVNYDFFSQNYLWLAANMTYVTPSFLVMFVFNYLYHHTNIGKKTFLLFVFLSIIIPMFVENIGCAYVFGLLAWNVYHFIKNKRVSIKLIIMLILSTISLVVMLKSPGSAIRMSQNSDFYELNFIEKIINNIPNFIFYIFNKNIFTLILMLIPINMFINKKTKGIKKILAMSLFNIIPIISILQNFRYMIPINLNSIIPVYNGIFRTNNWYFIFYWIILGLLFICSIFEFIKNKEEKIKTLILLIISVSSSLVMLLTPTWGDRCVVYTIITLIILSLKIININMKVTKKACQIPKVVLTLAIIYYLVIGIYNFAFEIRRSEYINRKNSENEKIIILFNKNLLLWNYTPWDELHMKFFKIYHGIDENEIIEIKIPSTKEVYNFLINGEIEE